MDLMLENMQVNTVHQLPLINESMNDKIKHEIHVRDATIVW